MNEDERPALPVRAIGQHRWEWQHIYEWHLDLDTLQIVESCICGKVHQSWAIDD